MTFFEKLFWRPLYGFDDKWDNEFNYLMDNHNFVPKIYDFKPENTQLSNLTAKLGAIEIWISNYPSSVFNKHHAGHHEQNHKSPKLKTILRAKEKLIKDYTEWFVENKPIRFFTKTEMRKVYHEWLVSKLFK